MKTLAARANTDDREDIKFLINKLNFERAEQVIEIVKYYYPHKEIKSATRFLIEEIFQRRE